MIPLSVSLSTLKSSTSVFFLLLCLCLCVFSTTKVSFPLVTGAISLVLRSLSWHLCCTDSHNGSFAEEVWYCSKAMQCLFTDRNHPVYSLVLVIGVVEWRIKFVSCENWKTCFHILILEATQNLIKQEAKYDFNCDTHT